MLKSATDKGQELIEQLAEASAGVRAAMVMQHAQDVNLLCNATREQTEGFSADFGDCWRAGEWLEQHKPC